MKKQSILIAILTLIITVSPIVADSSLAAPIANGGETGRLVYTSSERIETTLAVYDTQTQSHMALGSAWTGILDCYAVSADGMYIAYIQKPMVDGLLRDAEETLMLANLDTGYTHAIYYNSTLSCPQWLHNRQSIVYTVEDRAVPYTQIYEYQVSNSSNQRIATYDGFQEVVLKIAANDVVAVTELRRQRGSLDLMQPSQQPATIVQLTRRIADLQFSPDSRFVSFAGEGDQSEYYVHDTQTGQTILMTDTVQESVTDLAWHPHSQMFAFGSMTGGAVNSNVNAVFGADNAAQAGDIYLYDVQSSAVTNISNTSDMVESDPTWSPDGRFVAYYVGGANGQDVAIYDTTSGNVHHINQMTYDVINTRLAPVWSPPSDAVAFIRNDSLYVHQLGATEPLELTQGIVAVERIAWANDGQTLAVHGRADDGLVHIYLSNFQTGELYPLHGLGANQMLVTWLP